MEEVEGLSPSISTNFEIMNKKTNYIIEIIGWIGVVLIITSYCLLALGILDGQSPIYHTLVLSGAAFVAIISYKKRAFQPMMLNIIFVIFALIALFRIFSA